MLALRTDRAFAALASALAFALAGCAPMQVVPVDVGPGPVELYVDGERAEAVPARLELRADRDHKIFVKRDGFRPELVVLESRTVEGREQLVPGEVRVQLAPRAGEREVEIRDAAP